MVLDVRRALRTGYEELRSTDGLNVLAVLLVFNLIYGGVVASFRQKLLVFVRRSRAGTSPTISIESQVGWDLFQFDLPLWLLALLAVLAVLAGEMIRFWAIRQFANLSLRSPPDPRERLPVFLSVAGGFALLVFGVREVVPLFAGDAEAMILTSQVVGIASLLLVGVTVYLRQELALTSADAWETARKSIARFIAEPVPILGLLALLGLGGAFVGLPPVLAAFIVPASNSAIMQIGELVRVALSSILTTFSIAAVTDAYIQIRGGTFR